MKMKSGETCPKACSCKLCDAQGNVIRNIDVEAGQTLPPTPNSQCYFDVE